jgi:energy-coupling factor transport system permease protein
MNTFTWLVWLAAALVVVGLTNNPLYLLLVLLVTTLVFAACHEATPLARAYRLFFLAGLVLWLGYVLFSVVTVGGGRGQTALLALPSYTLPALLGGVTLGGAVTAEDLAWGAVRGLRIWTLLVIFGAFNALINHYRLLRLAPRSLFHVGLVVTIALTFVPQVIRALSEIRDAQRLRGHRFRGPRTYLPLVAPLLAGSLEKSIQLAEALDARGYGRTSASDAVRGLAQVWVIVGILLLGAGLFSWLYYGAATALPALLLIGSGGVLLTLAFRAFGRLVSRTIYRRERWRRRDSVVVVTVCGCVLGLVALRMTDVALNYNPYPVISAPPFNPLTGALLLLLGIPALLNDRPTAERASRRSRLRRQAPSRDTRAIQREGDTKRERQSEQVSR